MSRRRFIGLLIAALAAIAGALYVSSLRNATHDVRETLLLPTLAGELNTVTALRISKGGATPAVTIQQQGGQWTVAERANYPADVAKLRKLLLALSEAKIVEEKTSNPASYSIIGVEDPGAAGSGSAQVEVTAKDGKHAVIVGKPVMQGNFVRRAGEKTSYIAEPGISFDAEPRYWIDARVLDLPSAKVTRVDVKPPAGPAYFVHLVPVPAAAAPPAASPAVDKFVLEGVPNGRRPADSAVLAPSPSALSTLTAEDVAPVGDIDFSMPTVASMTLADGDVITFTGSAVGDKRWIQITSSKDAALNAKSQGRAFEIATYRYDSLFRPLEQLLVPKEPAPGAAKPGAKPAPTHGGAPAAKSPAAPGAAKLPQGAKKPDAASPAPAP